MYFQTYSATLVGGFIFFQVTGLVLHIIMSFICYFFLIEEKTEIAPRKAKFTKNEKLICHCFSFKRAVLFQVYSFSLFIFQIPKIKLLKIKHYNQIFIHPLLSIFF